MITMKLKVVRKIDGGAVSKSNLPVISLNSSHNSYNSSNGPNPCLFSVHPAPVSSFSLMFAQKMLKEPLCRGLSLCLDFWVLPLLPKRLALQIQVCWWVANTHFLEFLFFIFFRRSFYMRDRIAAAVTTITAKLNFFEKIGGENLSQFPTQVSQNQKK